MAPRIRGVAPPIKRRNSSQNLSVKSPQKKGSKQQTELDLRAQKFQKGEVVDVRLEEPGLAGSWHPAMICGVKPGLRQVELKKLLDNDLNPVKEWVLFGKGIVGPKLPAGTRKATDGKPVLRPGGPGLPPADPSFRKTGGWPKDLWVEVYSEEAWWEGVLLEDISASQMDEQDSVVDVIFPRLDDLVEQVAVKNLRECKDWNEETGLWSIRGRLGKENDPMRTVRSSSPVCEGEGGARGRGEDDHEMDRTSAENLNSAAEDEHRSREKSISPIKAKTGVNKYFGRLIDIVEQDGGYVVRVDTLHYTMDQISISLGESFISLDVTSENIETKVGDITYKVHNVCCALLELPKDKNLDIEQRSWDLDNEVLTIKIPKGDGGKDSVSPPAC